MTPRSAPLLLFFVCAVATRAEPSSFEEAVSLRQCYLTARETSEPLRRQREEIIQSQARARAALGGAFPKISWAWRGTRLHSRAGTWPGPSRATAAVRLTVPAGGARAYRLVLPRSGRLPAYVSRTLVLQARR